MYIYSTKSKTLLTMTGGTRTYLVYTLVSVAIGLCRRENQHILKNSGTRGPVIKI